MHITLLYPALSALLFVVLSVRTLLLRRTLGAAVLAGRVSHAAGVSRLDEKRAFPFVGMALTPAPLVVASVRLLHVFANANAA